MNDFKILFREGHQLVKLKLCCRWLVTKACIVYPHLVLHPIDLYVRSCNRQSGRNSGVHTYIRPSIWVLRQLRIADGPPVFRVRHKVIIDKSLAYKEQCFKYVAIHHRPLHTLWVVIYACINVIHTGPHWRTYTLVYTGYQWMYVPTMQIYDTALSFTTFDYLFLKRQAFL